MCVCLTELLVAKNQISIKFHQAEINLQLATRFLMWFVHVLMFKQAGSFPCYKLSYSQFKRAANEEGW